MNAMRLLAAVFMLAVAGQASAQHVRISLAHVPDSILVEIDPHYLDNCIKGYSKGEIVGADGVKHAVYVPVEVNGFDKFLPFHRNEQDLHKFGREPFSIDIDKVQSLHVNGMYQEHMVVAGKRKHVLATRVVNGPVELFNYTQMVESQMGVGMRMPLGGYIVCDWYLRRKGGELAKVLDEGFTAQMAEYFRDDADLVAALTLKKKNLRYQDMVVVVRAYNRHQAQLAGRVPAAK